MSDDFNDKYPHWKDALFGNDGAIANLRCAIHYVAWHGVYGAMGLVVLLIAGVVNGAIFIGERSGPLSGYIVGFANWVYSGVERVAKSSVTFCVFVSAFAVIFIGVLGMLVYQLIMLGLSDFWLLVKTLGMLIGMIAFWVLFVVVYEKYIIPFLGRAGERAKETPGIRRIYGNCPVSISQPPKWFDNLFEEDDE